MELNKIRIRKKLWISLGSVLLLFLYLLLWPVSIKPEKWEPNDGPALTGEYNKNEELISLVRIGENVVIGSEDISFDSKGRMYCGSLNGEIIRFTDDFMQSELLTKFEGPIFGLEVDDMDNLIAAVPSIGLIKIYPDGENEVLSFSADGVSFGMVNDLDIAKDGSIYFTDTSDKHSSSEIYKEIMEGQGRGRLLHYDPTTGKTDVLLDGLYFANGIAISPDNSYLLVCEMTRYRILKYWLKGNNAGKCEIFIENLPGMPDGISSNGDSTFWLGLHSIRSVPLDSVLYPNPMIRKILFRLPKFMRPQKAEYGFALSFDEYGNVKDNFQDPSGSFSPVSSVVEYDGYIFLGSTTQNGVGKFQL